MVKVTWIPRSRQDIVRIVRYVRSYNPQAAQELVAELEDRAEGLAFMPGIGRPGKRRGARELVLHPNYVATYREDPSGVLILRAYHAAQDR